MKKDKIMREHREKLAKEFEDEINLNNQTIRNLKTKVSLI